MKMGLPKLKAYSALITVAALWGFASPIIKFTLGYLPPFTFLFYRFLLTCIVTIPLYIWYLKKYPVKKSDFIPLTLIGYLAMAQLGFLFAGFERTTAIDGTVIGIVSPLLLVLFGVMFLKEKITKNERLGILIALLGTCITVVQPLFDGHAFPLENMFGNFIIVISTILFASFVFVSKKQYKHLSPFLITLHGSIVGLVLFFPLALIEMQYHTPLSMGQLFLQKEALFGLFYMAFFSYFLAYFLHEYGMEKIPISEGSIFTYLQPLFAVPLAYILLGETVSIPFIIGAVFIAVGVVKSELK